MLTCQSCGKANQPTRKFCIRCGASLLSTQVGSKEAPSPTISSAVSQTRPDPVVRPPETLGVTTGDRWVRPSEVSKERIRTGQRHIEKTELEKAREAFAVADKTDPEQRMVRASELRALMQSPTVSPQPTVSASARTPSVETGMGRPSPQQVAPSVPGSTVFVPPGGPPRVSTPISTPAPHASPETAVRPAASPTQSTSPTAFPVGAGTPQSPPPVRSAGPPSSVPGPSSPVAPITSPIGGTSPVGPAGGPIGSSTAPASGTGQPPTVVTPASRPAPTLQYSKPAEVSEARETPLIQGTPAGPTAGLTGSYSSLKTEIKSSETRSLTYDDPRLREMDSELSRLREELSRAERELSTTRSRLDEDVERYHRVMEEKRTRVESLEAQLRQARNELRDATDDYDRARTRRDRDVQSVLKYIEDRKRRIKSTEASREKRVREITRQSS